METGRAEQLLERGPLTLRIVAPNELRLVWDDVGPLIERACAYTNGHYTPESVVDGVLAGALHLLALDDGARITSVMAVSVNVTPGGMRELFCNIVGGEDMRAWMAFEPQMDALAEEAGCKRVRMIGRKGLAKMLPHWRLSGIVLEREIGGRLT